MAVNSKAFASDIINYYNRLNVIRVKFGIPQVSVPTFVQGMLMLSSDMIAVDNLLIATANATPKINKNLSLGNIAKGEIILAQTDINIRQMLTEWENTCNHDSHRSDDDDCMHDYHNENKDDDSGVCHCVSDDGCHSVCDAL